MKFIVLLFCILLLLVQAVSGENNIYLFDEKSDIIITTSVYKDGLPYPNASCNLTLFNPPPNENLINLSVYLNNKGNGIYSYNLTSELSYNNEIYPLILYCNDSAGYYGQDDRIGLKIGVNLYDYIIPGAILLTIAFLFIYMSFKVTETLLSMRLLFLYLGLAFVLSSLFYGLSVTASIPQGESFKLIFQILIPIFVLIIFLLIYLQFTDKLKEATDYLLGTK